MSRVIRFAACPVMPWKNGGGSTTEIAAFPEGADLAGFDWRISMARVASDGPFSLFPGIDRTLAVVDGAGLRLAVDGRAPLDLTAETPPYAFPADRPTAAALLGGPVTDLNVMSRRGRFRHVVAVLVLEAGQSVAGFDATTFLVARGGPARLAGAEGVSTLAERDVLSPRDGSPALTALAPCSLFRIDLAPA